MILKGSQRGGSGQLALHLMNDRDNDHVTLQELRGFMSDDLAGALDEAHAMSMATQCRQFMFSLSLNPPKDAQCSVEDLQAAANRAEEVLGLGDQPRALIIHEKRGRRHAHVVWSRIDADEMKAVPMPFFKNKLNALAKELYLEHGWDLPDGLKENGWKNPLNFTLAEWQQAQRLDLDPKELKQLFREAWQRSDNAQSFAGALEAHGYYLARGDRRGFVAVDLHGEVFSVARMVGEKTKTIEARLGSPERLRSVDEVTADNSQLMTDRLRDVLDEQRQLHAEKIKELQAERLALVEAQRQERDELKTAQESRWAEENAERQSKFRKGVRGLWDVLTGRAAHMRAQNESEAFAAHRRDVDQRQQLFDAQMEERRDVTERLEACREEQRDESMRTSRQIAYLLKLERYETQDAPERERSRHRGHTLH
jgi:hypothetical protein